MLQRKSRNPVTGFVLVSDSSETTRRAQMDLVLARAEAANVPIHSFGYGRSHDPASLWLMSNHTSGTYTFVKDWYDLRDCLAGCIGGMMSIAIMNMKLHLKIVDGNRFRIRKISGGPIAILSSDGRDVDVEVGELRYGERKEMLVELELDNSDLSQSPLSPKIHQSPRSLNATDVFNQRMGLDALSIGDFTDLSEGMMDRMIDEVPVFEVDGSFFDPNAGKNVSRLAHPVLLTVTLLPSTGSRPRTPAHSASDPVIVRRRMELLASDMITRMLVLVSRRNMPQAQKLMSETRRILHTVLQNITQNLPPPGREGGAGRNRKEVLTLQAVRALQSIMQDMQILSEALDEQADTFALDQRNFGAQQVCGFFLLRCVLVWTCAESYVRHRQRCYGTRRAGVEGAQSSVCSGQSTALSSWSLEVLIGLPSDRAQSPTCYAYWRFPSSLRVSICPPRGWLAPTLFVPLPLTPFPVITVHLPLHEPYLVSRYPVSTRRPSLSRSDRLSLPATIFPRLSLYPFSLSLSLSLSSDCLAVRVSRVASCSIVPVSFDKRHAHVLFSPSRLSTSLVYYPTLYPLPVCVCSCVSSARHVRYTLS